MEADEPLKAVPHLADQPPEDIRCPICGAQRPALILDQGAVISDDLAEALDDGRAILPRQPIPDPRPTWVCQACGSWVYYDGVDSQSLYPI